MLRGLTTVTCQAPDLAAAKQWYTELLGCDILGFVCDPHHTCRWRLGDRAAR